MSNLASRKAESAESVERLGKAALRWQHWMEWGTSEGLVVRGVSLTPPEAGGGGEWRMVVRASFEGSALVGFVYSETLAGVFEKFDKELRDGSIKWKIDSFAK